MKDTIRVYGANSTEHTRLEAAAMLINSCFDSRFADAKVEDVWWDYGGGLKWTTIVIGDTQVLNPLQHTKLVAGPMSDFAEVVTEVTENHKKHVNLINNIKYGVIE